MKRVYLALPTEDSVAEAIHERLERRKFAKNLQVVEELSAAQVVVTSTADIDSLPERLPESVELLQLTDCGGGQRYRDAPNLTISNASDLMCQQVSLGATLLLMSITPQLARDWRESLMQLGVIGLGTVARTFLDLLIEISVPKDPDVAPEQYPFGLNRLVISDIRTPRQGHIPLLQRNFGHFGISARRVTLDQLLSTSDVVFVAAHHGTTADPLLGKREARLLSPKAWVIDASGSGVVARAAFNVVSPDVVERLIASEPPDRNSAGQETGEPTSDESIGNSGSRPNYVRVDDIAPEVMREFNADLVPPTKVLAKFVPWKLRRYARGKPILLVEHLDFPTAGDPAFWSSLMSPSQT